MKHYAPLFHHKRPETGRVSDDEPMHRVFLKPRVAQGDVQFTGRHLTMFTTSADERQDPLAISLQLRMLRNELCIVVGGITDALHPESVRSLEHEGEDQRTHQYDGQQRRAPIRPPILQIPPKEQENTQQEVLRHRNKRLHLDEVAETVAIVTLPGNS